MTPRASAPLTFVPVAALAELPVGEMVRVEVGDEEIVVYRTAEGLFATDDFCSHMRVRFSEGYLEGTVVECPLDGGTFDVRSGKPIQAPCPRAVRTHPVRVEGETVLVGLPVTEA